MKSFCPVNLSVTTDSYVVSSEETPTELTTNWSVSWNWIPSSGLAGRPPPGPGKGRGSKVSLAAAAGSFAYSTQPQEKTQTAYS